MGRQVLQLEQRLLAEVNIEEMHSYTQGHLLCKASLGR